MSNTIENLNEIYQFSKRFNLEKPNIDTNTVFDENLMAIMIYHTLKLHIILTPDNPFIYKIDEENGLSLNTRKIVKNLNKMGIDDIDIEAIYGKDERYNCIGMYSDSDKYGKALKFLKNRQIVIGHNIKINPKIWGGINEEESDNDS